MPSTPRSRRTGAGPGRGSPRSRTASRSQQATRSSARRSGRTPAPKAPAPTPGTKATVTAQRVAARQVTNLRNLGLTRRAFALFVVLAVLALSYASSLRIYLETEHKNAQNKQSIEQSSQRIDQLNAELRRWDDPDYVRAQARERLGWVMPGDTGYRVVGADGRPIGPQLEATRPNPQAPNPDAWWDRMWGSLNAADHPPVAPDPALVNKPPITDGTNTPTPKPSPTPSASPTKKTR